MIKEKMDFVLCIENKDCEDLEKRKVYQIIPDKKAESEGYFRIIDESEDDYLYPQSYFIAIQLPKEAHNILGTSR